jgi:hypothetical protein
MLFNVTPFNYCTCLFLQNCVLGYLVPSFVMHPGKYTTLKMFTADKQTISII